MKLTRYQFKRKDDTLGLFMAIKSLDLLRYGVLPEEDKELLIGTMCDFDYYMNYPHIEYNENFRCFFTEEGVKAFQDALNTIKDIFDRNLKDYGTVECITLDIDDSDKRIAYKDIYQAVVCMKQPSMTLERALKVYKEQRNAQNYDHGDYDQWGTEQMQAADVIIEYLENQLK